MECTHYIGVLIVLGTNCCVFKSANVPLIQIKILKIYCRSNNRVKIVIKRHLYDWGRGRGQLYLKAESDVNVFCAKEKKWWETFEKVSLRFDEYGRCHLFD